uniref:Uncharacterized protein n=1 Tax=Chenopodium quinoa TaxID=63459 RepID=A0A803LE28_CHEQI
MEMRVLTAENKLPAAVDHMNSNCSTPYMSAASSPRRPRPQLDFFFYSAPTSPRSYNHHSMFADVYDDYSAEDVALLKHDHSSAAVPFDWELKPGVAKSTGVSYSKDEDNQQHEQVMEHAKEEFEFDFSGQLDMMVRPPLSSADELFDGGKIRPLKLKPPPSLQINTDSRISSESHSPRSPKSAMSKFKDALNVSPKHRRKGSDEDPFEAAIRSITRTSVFERKQQFKQLKRNCMSASHSVVESGMTSLIILSKQIRFYFHRLPSSIPRL